MAYCEFTQFTADANNYKPVLFTGVFLIVNSYGLFIFKYRFSFFKRNTMLFKIHFTFFWIPLEFQSKPYPFNARRSRVSQLCAILYADCTFIVILSVLHVKSNTSFPPLYTNSCIPVYRQQNIWWNFHHDFSTIALCAVNNAKNMMPAMRCKCWHIGGRGGIRTHGTLRYTAFRVRLVMTTSILFRILSCADKDTIK